MPTFEYIAKDITGRQRDGVMQAESHAAVVRTLGERALFPVRIAPQAPAAPRFGWGRKIKLRQIGAAYGQLSDLLAAGVPMLRALEILSRTAANPRLGRIVAEVRDTVAGGETLADSLARHPKVFTELHVAMVRAGEHAGFLEEVLTNLASFLERQDDLRSKVRGAMVYPAVLATLGVGAVAVMLLFFVPMFKQFLGAQHLPLPSRVLFGLSDAVRGHAWLALGAAAAIVLAGCVYLRGESGRKLWARAKLKIPLAGRAIRMVAITRFCRVLGTMLANGVPIIQALAISKDATGNAIMAEAVDAAAENVRAGEPLADPLQRSGLFPEEIIEMIAVGEESNQLERVLVQTADTVERRTNRQVDTAVRLVEPLLLMFMAGAIGFIALGLVYPIFTMARSMR
jgi:general secretion pathway protein F